MAESDLIQKIISDAEIEAEKIIEETKKAAEAKLAITAKEAETIQENILNQYTKKATQEKSQILAEVRQSNRLKTESIKHKNLEAVKNQALATIINWSSDDYIKWLENLASLLPDSITNAVCLAPESRQNETKQALGSKGQDLTITASPDLLAGIIIETEREVYNLSAGKILNQTFDDHKSELAQRLFQE